jgi:hypothetical protein
MNLKLNYQKADGVWNQHSTTKIIKYKMTKQTYISRNCKQREKYIYIYIYSFTFKHFKSFVLSLTDIYWCIYESKMKNNDQ